MPRNSIRYRPMTTYAVGRQRANDGPSKQKSIPSYYSDHIISRSWYKARLPDFSLPSPGTDLVELCEKLLERPRESAKRFFRLQTLTRIVEEEEETMSLSVQRPDRSRPHSEIFVGADEDRVAQYMAAQILDRNNSSNGSLSGGVSRPISRDRSNSDDSNIMSTGAMPTLRNERVVASGNGISVSIALAEPLVFLPSYDHSDPSTKRSAILRGHLHIKTTKSVKVKKVSICFRGQAQTDWPDGIPPKKINFHDKKDIMTSGMIYFNHGETAIVQNPYGAHYYKVANTAPLSTSKEPKIYSVTTTTRELLKNGSTTTVNKDTARDLKRLSLQSNHSRSFNKNDAPNHNQPQAVRNYRLFPPGDYLYAFEFPIDGSMPETIKSDLGFVRYDLEAIVERSGAFRPNLLGSTEIEVVRTPAEGSLEQVEPIAISRNWEDQLHYDIVISGKSFPMGSQVPIAFKLTPLAKVECHRIKVYVTENIQHWTQDKFVHRLQPPKKVLLFEKRADQPSVSTYPGSSMRVTAGGGVPWDQREAAARGEEQVNRGVSSLLGNLSNDVGVGPTEMEFSVQLPSCHAMKGKDEAHKLHFDTTYENIQINHWIKIVMRLSKTDEKDPTKRRHFEISIDSPFHILSCKATQGNIFLPAYSDPSSDPAVLQDEYTCGCPGAPMTRRSTPTSRINSSSSLTQINNNNTNNTNNDTNGSVHGTRGLPRSFTSGSGGLSRPEQAHIAHEPNERDARPMHLLRTPSFAPPAFEELEPPPPLITPPPEYASIVGNIDRETVLTDYFNRLSYFEEQDDEERGLGRVDVPLTPGGRVHRSMDVPREWVRLGDATVQ
ncbi:arrestin domain protein [Talaromyces stipitatus ATCC 10500]|uniref:Arrestin domain protein n=1 Tax=Talaromyces stipitatus (strain ATCC 10500 / CBS 375.48 / QM 6759 / NRRL 1006) TaxID=441959 RepID=B8MK27_TALSN|nr:arrestin domain protein [Talaromyces stipitatus ATCC 10500]EED14844.1 arrestin domain protein [Talaromyces stipitatus ATCC 10500]